MLRATVDAFFPALSPTITYFGEECLGPPFLTTGGTLLSPLFCPSLAAPLVRGIDQLISLFLELMESVPVLTFQSGYRCGPRQFTPKTVAPHRVAFPFSEGPLPCTESPIPTIPLLVIPDIANQPPVFFTDFFAPQILFFFFFDPTPTTYANLWVVSTMLNSLCSFPCA